MVTAREGVDDEVIQTVVYFQGTKCHILLNVMGSALMVEYSGVLVTRSCKEEV